MEFSPAKLSRYKQVLGIAVAGIILTVIFVPLQPAQAYTAELTLPNASPGAVPTSAVGSTFRVTITPSVGELISVSTIELILDNGTPDVNRAVFASNGHRVDGSPNLVRGNLDITIPTPTTQGYGYGYGVVSSGTTFSSPYSYAFTYSNAFIAGNTVGYSNAVSGANLVTGIVGDGTAQIIIEGKLNTALMDVGSHTLDILVNTGAGGNGVDKIVTPQLSFTTVGNSSVGSSTVSAGSDVTVQDFVPGVPAGKLKVKFTTVGNGALSVQKGPPADIQALLNQVLFSSTSTNTATFSFGGSTVTTAGESFEFDISGLESVGGVIEITVPYDESLIPAGISEANLRLYHWTGTVWEDITVSVDTVNNTITGQTTSLSPVVPGYTSTSSPPVGTVTTPGGGGVNVYLGVLPESFLEKNPLLRVQIHDHALLNAAGERITSVRSGEQITITGSFKNNQGHSQNYAFIVQIVDEDGITTDIGWLTGNLELQQNTEGSRSWLASEPGNYTVRIFVWDNVTTPIPLTEMAERTFRVIS